VDDETSEQNLNKLVVVELNLREGAVHRIVYQKFDLSGREQNLFTAFFI
jgi:hypothetical protein